MADVSERGSCGLNPQGEDIYINCCHPGLVKSDLFREAVESGVMPAHNAPSTPHGLCSVLCLWRTLTRKRMECRPMLPSLFRVGRQHPVLGR
eukprot:1027455-Rhodomonas_salina.2